MKVPIEESGHAEEDAHGQKHGGDPQQPALAGQRRDAKQRDRHGHRPVRKVELIVADVERLSQQEFDARYDEVQAALKNAEGR